MRTRARRRSRWPGPSRRTERHSPWLPVRATLVRPHGARALRQGPIFGLSTCARRSFIVVVSAVCGYGHAFLRLAQTSLVTRNFRK